MAVHKQNTRSVLIGTPLKGVNNNTVCSVFSRLLSK